MIEAASKYDPKTMDASDQVIHSQLTTKFCQSKEAKEDSVVSDYDLCDDIEDMHISGDVSNTDVAAKEAKELVVADGGLQQKYEEELRQQQQEKMAEAITRLKEFSFVTLP